MFRPPVPPAPPLPFPAALPAAQPGDPVHPEDMARRAASRVPGAGVTVGGRRLTPDEVRRRRAPMVEADSAEDERLATWARVLP